MVTGTNMAMVTDMDAVNGTLHDYIVDTMPQNQYNARAVLKMFLENAQVKYHGGQSIRLPIRDASLGAAAMYDASIGTTITPAATDIAGSLQNQWGFWYAHASYDHTEYVRSIGSHASDEAVIDLIKAKEDALMDDIGNLFETQLTSGGDATGNNIIGPQKLFDTTNTNYLGANLTSAAYTPKVVTLATSSIASLTIADLFDLYEDLEDAGVYPDKVMCHPETITKLRNIAWGATDLSPGDSVKFGHGAFSLIRDETKFVPCRYMPSGTSARLWFFNFGNDVKGGNVEGGKDYKVKPGNFWHLSFAGPKGLGFDLSEWYAVQLRPLCYVKQAAGAFMISCNNPRRQGYAKVA